MPKKLRRVIKLDTTETQKAKRLHEEREHERWRGALGLPKKQPSQVERRAALREARARRAERQAALWELSNRLLLWIVSLLTVLLVLLFV